ncbi:acetoacetyl-CoA synthetase [Trichonephila clavata]|uniref:Acetoacetyl-CoA synthetase n=1 Tax=Trichonephila clavata TaxID=2740835 RepID=A0A8X6HTB2_TRICU|nr:acetoacetyl-CoA synthetase [Trichonephila clavata]
MPGSVVTVNSFENTDTLKVSIGKNGCVDVMGKQTTLVWNKKVPSTEIDKFRKIIEKKYNRHFGSYWEFQKWSVENYTDFWEELWHYFGIIASKPYNQVLLKTGNGFLDNDWFSGATFNFAENVLRIRDNRTALICADEFGNDEMVTFAEMFNEVKLYAAAFRKHGLGIGDRVACYMSNRKEAVFAMLATASIGAVWSGPLPYYGARIETNLFLSREWLFGRVAPAEVLKSYALDTIDTKYPKSERYPVTDGSYYEDLNNVGSGVFSSLFSFCTPVKIRSTFDGTPCLEKVIIIPTRQDTFTRDFSDIRNSVLLEEFLQSGRNPDGLIPDIVFEQLPFSHPICINFTSGTTGLPKGPVHSAAVGWSLWDYPVPSLALGVKIFLYNGSPYFNRKGSNIWDIFSQYKVSFAFLATTMVDKLEKEKIAPTPGSNFDSLKVIGIGGSPVKRQNFEYLHRTVKKDLFVGSMYGATEVFGAFSGFDFNTPSYGGEIQAPALGVDIRCYDHNGNSIVGQRGELVIGTPSPSFPVFLWKDTDNKRLYDTYFTKYPGVWSQNDECWINPNTNGIIVIGRSDDTLKQNGERFGSGDIYFAIHQMEELQDYLCVGQDGCDGDTRAVLFVKLKKGYSFTPQLREKIASLINRELWEDYVPQVIMEVPDIPYNLNNKRMESLVRKIVATNQVPEVMNIKNPDCLKHFCDIPELVNYKK